MATKDFTKLMFEIETGRQTKEVLRDPAVQQLFTEHLQEAGNVALEIERLVVPEDDDQNALHSAGNTVLRLYKLDDKLLGSLLTGARFNKEQRTELMQVCEKTLEALSKSVGLIFEGHIKKRPLIEGGEVHTLIKEDDSERNKLKSETWQRAFISYLALTGKPHIILERMARFSLYQEFNFEDDLKKNKVLRDFFKEFVREGVLPKNKSVQAAKLIEDSILNNMRKHHLAVRADKNGYDVAKSVDVTKTKIDILYDGAPSHSLDAYTFSKGTLHALNVTTKFSLEDNNLGAITNARALRHGIIRAELEDIDNFEIAAYCSSAARASKELQTVLDVLEVKNLIDKGQRQSLTDLPIHQEILKTLANISTKEYKDLAEIVRYGIYGDEHPALSLKSSAIQSVQSTQQLVTAAETLQKVLDLNPTLDRMRITVEELATNLKTAYGYASEIAYKHKHHATLNAGLEKVYAVLGNVYERLIKARSPIAGSIIPVKGPESAIVLRGRDAMAATYNDIEKALSNDTPTKHAVLRTQKPYNTVSLTNPAMVTTILGGNYPAATEGIIKEALMQRINEIEIKMDNGSIRKDSLVSLRKGFQTLFELKNGKALAQEVYAHAVEHAPFVCSAMMAMDGVGVETRIQKEMKKYVKEHGLVESAGMSM